MFNNQMVNLFIGLLLLPETFFLKNKNKKLLNTRKNPPHLPHTSDGQLKKKGMGSLLG